MKQVNACAGGKLLLSAVRQRKVPPVFCSYPMEYDKSKTVTTKASTCFYAKKGDGGIRLLFTEKSVSHSFDDCIFIDSAIDECILLITV